MLADVRGPEPRINEKEVGDGFSFGAARIGSKWHAFGSDFRQRNFDPNCELGDGQRRDCDVSQRNDERNDSVLGLLCGLYLPRLHFQPRYCARFPLGSLCARTWILWHADRHGRTSRRRVSQHQRDTLHLRLRTLLWRRRRF